ncbi:uncharacterized protein LOC123672897 [Harmonia axyridis]|uniref:uncharacterized protein LOC123672897 n=1 Tax=Harmonia axyridis TaxID=115357 RepID=UPI001E27533E|nr:uncharacterized protein LOC123672897 [Harmonia axyridis]
MPNMIFRFVIAFTILSVIGYVSTVPLPLPQSHEELLKDFSQFLQENEDIAKALRNADVEHFMTRNRRDAVDDSMMDVDLAKEPRQKEEGFFDRAAKFMMEVLQRFLKWVNSDN